jgi:DNA-binding NarL/FixJ family response regulator
MIRVLLADDQALFREGLRAVLTAKGVEVVGEAATGEEAVELAMALLPEVVLMDLRMPGGGGVAAIRRLAALAHPPRVIALTTFDDDQSVFEALRAGALGYLLKDTDSARLVEAIQHAARGESLLQPSVAARVVSEFARLAAPRRPADLAAELGLSEREVAVLRALALGQSNKEIAVELGITEGTVKNHVTSILAKLGVTDRLQAALRARELGLVAPR